MLDVKTFVEQQVWSSAGARLLIITDGQDGPNQSYIRSKVSFAQRIGIDPTVLVCEKDRLENTLYNQQGFYDGVIVQYPFYDLTFDQLQLKLSLVLDPKRDVDGLCSSSYHHPCTPLGILLYLRKLGTFDRMLIIGKGRLIGRPLNYLAGVLGYKTTVVDSSWSSEALKEELLTLTENDCVVCATPVPRLINESNFNPLPTYIDCGTYLEGKKILGNVDRSLYCDQHKITPVPGGVGILTVMALMKNTFWAKELLKDVPRMPESI